jgi:hypothetical protein
VSTIIPTGDPTGQPTPWDEPSAHLIDPAARLWSLDGLQPIPDPVIAMLDAAGSDFRMAHYGRLTHIVRYAFAGVGERTVFVCEKIAVVWLPEHYDPAHPSPYAVQGVLRGEWPGLLALLSTL